MPAISAERLCPEAIFVPPDFVRYKEASRGAREIFIAIPISLNHYLSMKPIWT
jgi:nucleotidyltransferase/DNA polymerase involved in DNA repair